MTTDAGAELQAPFRVRTAGPADAELVVAFNRAMARETEGRELDPEALRAGVESLLGDPSRGRYFLAETTEGRAAGQLMITYEWSDWRNGFVWWIQSVYVAPALRRRGVYTALHRRAQASARAAGAVGIRLYVERDNRRAQAAYRALGMAASRYVLFEEMWEEAEG